MAFTEELWRRTLGWVYEGSPDVAAALLERMAKSTGGRYFRAEDGSGLQDVMKQIDALETVEFEQPKFIDYNDLYDRWLYGGLIVILLALAFENTISLKVP